MGRTLPQPWRLKCRPTSVGAPLPAKRPPGLTELKIGSRRRYRAAIMVNGRLRISCPGRGAASFTPLRRAGIHISDGPRISSAPLARCAASGERTSCMLAVNHHRIEQPVRIHERQLRSPLACVDLAVEAGSAAGVAGRSRLLDPNPYRILLAIPVHLHHPLDVSGGFALSPQPVAPAAEIPRVP